MSAPTSRSKYRRKLLQCESRIKSLQDTIAEVGAMYEGRNEQASEGCMAVHESLDYTLSVIKQIAENL